MLLRIDRKKGKKKLTVQVHTIDADIQPRTQGGVKRGVTPLRASGGRGNTPP